MNYHSQNNSFNQSDAVKIFANVTGITIHEISYSDNTAFTMYCDACIKTISKIISLPHFPFYCNLYFFPCGACHIFADSKIDSTSFFISEPIVCEHSFVDTCPLHPQKAIVHLPSAKLFDVAKLLYFAVNGSLEPFFDELPYLKLKKILSDACLRGDSECIIDSIDNALDEILAETGLDFYKTKAACIKIICLLQEIETEYMDTLLPEKNRCFSFYALSKADTLGKLKLCLSSACDDFLQALNNEAGLKKNMVINQAIKLIKRDFRDKITQNSVANAVYLSPSYFSKLFKEVTGYNFSEYLNIVRIEKAKEMLEKTSLSIDAVYQRVGFENRSYFGKVFRKLTDMTPKQYKDTFDG